MNAKEIFVNVKRFMKKQMSKTESDRIKIAAGSILNGDDLSGCTKEDVEIARMWLRVIQLQAQVQIITNKVKTVQEAK